LYYENGCCANMLSYLKMGWENQQQFQITTKTVAQS